VSLIYVILMNKKKKKIKEKLCMSIVGMFNYLQDIERTSIKQDEEEEE
jgi:hypothetical protein